MRGPPVCPYNRPMLRIAVCFIVLCALAAPAHAWGPRGHRLVAHLAQAQLTPHAQRQVQALLAGQPETDLAGIANWADQLRSHDPALGRRSARWHYVNFVEGSCQYLPARDCPDGDCVIAAIDAQAAILADPARSHAERLQALKFVVHFVGDVHQPMHAGHGHDRGGNTVQVNLRDGSRSGHGTNLHALWDSGLFRGLDESEAQHLARLQRLEVDVPDTRRPAAWAQESCAVVMQPGVYPPRRRVGQAYVQQWRPVAEQRLVAAGQRLAQLLNRVLDEPQAR